MNTAWRRGLAAGALVLPVALLGCEPTPDYGPQAPPYVGEIYAENSVLATGTPQQLGILPTGNSGQYAVTLSLPAGAYAPGIQVTLRWVTDLALVTDESLQLGDLVGNSYYDPYGALQVLPPSPVPAYAGDHLLWSWEPGYRASAALGIEFDEGRWSARIDGGVGYLLNDPRCRYDNGFIYTEGCDSPEVPAPYRFQGAAGAGAPSGHVLTRLQLRPRSTNPRRRRSNRPARPSGFPLPQRWFPWRSAWACWWRARRSAPRPILGQALHSSAPGSASAPASVMPTRENICGLALVRAAGLFVGSFLVLVATIKGDCEDGPPGSCNTSSSSFVPGAAFLLAVPVLAVYDIVKAPQSARRANERNRLGDATVVPTVTTSGPTPSRGLCLAGRF